MRKSHFPLFFLIVMLVLGMFTVFVPNVKAQSSEGWVSRYVYDVDYGNGTYTSTTFIGTQVFWDGSEWRELHFEDHYLSDGYYLIENSHITAKIYDWYTVFLDPDNSRVCVDDERWIIETQDKQGKWYQICDYNVSLTYSNNETHLTVTRTFDTYEGTFEVNYILWQGSRLKHDVKFTSKIDGVNQFRVTMKLTGIYHDKVKHSEGIENIIGEKHIISPYFFVGENNSNLVFSEYLWSLGETNETTGEWKATTLKDIVFDVHAHGCKVDIIIGNYTLAENESLLIDPDSDTFNSMAGDGQVYGSNVDYTTVHDATSAPADDTSSYVKIFNRFYNDKYYISRGFTAFNTSSVPNDATINSAKIRLYSYSQYLNEYDDDLCIVEGTQASPTSLEDGDYDNVGTAIAGSILCSNFLTNQYHNITLNATGLAWINKTGYTKLAIRMHDDIDAITPTVNRPMIYIYCSEQGSDYAPKLEITWTTEEGEAYTVDLTKTFSASFSMFHQTNYKIPLTFTPSTTFINLLQSTFHIPLTFTPSTTFTLGTACNFIVNFAFQPSVSFTLDIFYKAYGGVLYIVDLMFTPMVTFTHQLQTSYNIILAFTPSVTFTKIMQATYTVLLNFAPTVTFTLKAMGNYFVDFIFQPSVTFTLDLIHELFTGVQYYVDLIFTPIVNFSLDIVTAFPYGIRHVIGLAIIAFVLAIIGICFAVTKKD